MENIVSPTVACNCMYVGIPSHCKNQIHTKLSLKSYQSQFWYDSSDNLVYEYYSYFSFAVQTFDDTVLATSYNN